MFIEYPNNQYHEGIEIDEYNGTISLVKANRADDGKVWKKWCYPQGRGKGAGPIEKSLPWKIELGSRQQAVELLQKLLQAISGGMYDDQIPPPDDTQQGPPVSNIGGDIPF